MQRTSSWHASLFLLGGVCAHGIPLFSDHHKLSDKWVSFFRDDGSENTVKPGPFGYQDGHPLRMHPGQGVISSPDHQIHYSSVWNKDPLGKSEDEWDAYTGSFGSVDTDGDGCVSAGELADYRSTYEVNASLASIDTDGDGCVSEDEWDAFTGG
jgi:hypothetical protein